MTIWPPATSVSLLAVATTLPARSAASTGRRLTTPPVATTTRSTSSRVASSIERRVARGPFRALREVQTGEGVAFRECHDCRPQLPCLFRERRPIPAGRQCDDAEELRVRGDDLDRLGADRARGAEERDAARLR